MFETGETHCPTLKTKNPENILRKRLIYFNQQMKKLTGSMKPLR